MEKIWGGVKMYSIRIHSNLKAAFTLAFSVIHMKFFIQVSTNQKPIVDIEKVKSEIITPPQRITKIEPRGVRISGDWRRGLRGRGYMYTYG